MPKNTAVFGLYHIELEASAAVDRLRRAGFRNSDVSILFSENTGNKDLAHEKNTKAPEGAAAGAGFGAVLGSTLGWLAGSGLLAIPGLGLFLSAGPIMGLLGGAGLMGALAGVAGALIGSGIPEYEAKRYVGRIRKGGVLLSVHCDDSDYAKRAKEILDNTGAEDIASAPEAKADFGATDTAQPRTMLPVR
jgi:Protein of unknown function (DUF3341)